MNSKFADSLLPADCSIQQRDCSSALPDPETALWFPYRQRTKSLRQQPPPQSPVRPNVAGSVFCSSKSSALSWVTCVQFSHAMSTIPASHQFFLRKISQIVYRFSIYFTSFCTALKLSVPDSTSISNNAISTEEGTAPLLTIFSIPSILFAETLLETASVTK